MPIKTLGRRLQLAYREGREPFWALTSQAVTSAGNFATTVILVRALGLVEFGRYSAAFLVMLVTRNFLIGVLLTPMAAIAPKLHDRAARNYRAFILLQALCFAGGTSALLLAGGWATGALLGLAWVTAMTPAMALANFTANMADFYQRHLFVQNHSATAASIDFIRFGAQILMLLAMAFAAPKWLTVNSALGVLALGSLIACLLGIRLFGAFKWRASFARAIWPRHRHMMLWLTPSFIFNAIIDPGLVFLAGSFLGERAIGALRATQNIGNILMLPVNAMQRVAASIGARRFHEAGYPALAAYQTRLAIAVAIQSALLALAVFATRHWLIEIAVGEYQPQLASLLVLFAISNVFASLRFAYTIALQSIEKPRPITVNSAICAASGVALALMLVKPAGPEAVPAIRIVIYAYGALALWRAFTRIAKPDRTVRPQRGSESGRRPLAGSE